MVAQPYRKDAAKPQAEYEDPTIEYPCEDGEPLAETDWQYVPLTETVSALRVHFSDRADVYVAGDMFVYYRMNVVQAVVAPDVYVVFGTAGNHKRNSWFIWREGATPAFVMEIAAEGTWRRDANEKRDIYAEMGVIEYWRFDPTGNCFSPPLVGERLESGEYRPIAIAPDADGVLRGRSGVLGLDICVRPELDLRLFDPASGEWLRNTQEYIEALETSQAALEAAQRRIRELEARLGQQPGEGSS